MKFKFLEHTADSKFQAFGNSLEEAFSNAALAFTSVMIDYKKINPKITKKISAKGTDFKNLLYNFLEQLIILVDTENFIVSKVKSLKIKNLTLTAEIIGDNLQNYEVHNHIKAVTYNQMEIKEKPYMVQVILDI